MSDARPTGTQGGLRNYTSVTPAEIRFKAYETGVDSLRGSRQVRYRI
jgi:hypothetical protein